MYAHNQQRIVFKSLLCVGRGRKSRKFIRLLYYFVRVFFTQRRILHTHTTINIMSVNLFKLLLWCCGLCVSRGVLRSLVIIELQSTRTRVVCLGRYASSCYHTHTSETKIIILSDLHDTTRPNKRVFCRFFLFIYMSVSDNLQGVIKS